MSAKARFPNTRKGEHVLNVLMGLNHCLQVDSTVHKIKLLFTIMELLDVYYRKTSQMTYTEKIYHEGRSQYYTSALSAQIFFC